MTIDAQLSTNAQIQDPAYEKRAAFADRYYTVDLKKQREWYSAKADTLKKRAEAAAFVVILLGAATIFVQALPAPEWKSIASAAFGALIVMIEGWKKIARYDETWRAYRVASERMKHERRLYVNSAGPYQDVDEEAAKKLFVAAVEDIISEEQHIFWSSRELKPGSAHAA